MNNGIQNSLDYISMIGPKLSLEESDEVERIAKKLAAVGPDFNTLMAIFEKHSTNSKVELTMTPETNVDYTSLSVKDNDKVITQTMLSSDSVIAYHRGSDVLTARPIALNRLSTALHNVYMFGESYVLLRRMDHG